MLARTALARLRAKVPSAAARDVAQLSRQLRTVLATSVSTTTNATAAAATLGQLQRFRGYATATATKAKPRASTTTTKKAAPAKKAAAATKKTAAAAPKKKAAAPKKAPAKPKKKAAAKPKPKAKKELTEAAKERLEKQKLRKVEQKQKDAIKLLKETALHTEPKGKPSTAFLVYSTEAVYNAYADGKKPEGGVPSVIKETAPKFKTLDSAELERLNHIANQNEAENKKAYKKWLESHTPQQIREANKARRMLKTKLATYSKRQIQDSRAPKHPRTAFLLFFTDRYATGDFKGMSIPEAAKLAGKEWTALSASGKQKYENASAEERKRWFRESKDVYGVEPKEAKKAKDTTNA